MQNCVSLLFNNAIERFLSLAKEIDPSNESFIKFDDIQKTIVLEAPKFERTEIKLDAVIKMDHDIFTGSFFGGEYKSSLVFISKNKYVELNRVFSPPFDKKLSVIFKKKDKIYKKQLEKENVLENFLERIEHSLSKNNYNYFYQSALRDAKFRDEILLKS